MKGHGARLAAARMSVSTPALSAAPSPASVSASAAACCSLCCFISSRDLRAGLVPMERAASAASALRGFAGTGAGAGAISGCFCAFCRAPAVAPPFVPPLAFPPTPLLPFLSEPESLSLPPAPPPHAAAALSNGSSPPPPSPSSLPPPLSSASWDGASADPRGTSTSKRTPSGTGSPARWNLSARESDSLRLFVVLRRKGGL